LARLAEVAREEGPVGVHVKIDTGMHRAGVAPEHAARFLAAVRQAGLGVEGLWTHFAVAEELDDPFTGMQLGLFRSVVSTANDAGFTPRYLHAANSAAALSLP